MSESGWVIERYFNGELRYWEGRGIEPHHFSAKHEDAIRFARERDAAMVLSWCLGGNGRASEHEWMDDKEVAEALAGRAAPCPRCYGKGQTKSDAMLRQQCTECLGTGTVMR